MSFSLLSLSPLLALQKTKQLVMVMGVNCNGIENLLARFTANVWINDNFEEKTIDIDRTQGNDVIALSQCSHIPSL
jgi:hypothetical protein